MSSLIVSIHDVSPATAAETAWWVAQLERLGGRASLLVIPGPWRGRSMSAADPLAESLRSWAGRGHEISLHGWDHLQPACGGPMARLLARGAAEFASLGRIDAEARLTAGLSVLSANDLFPIGFTPPGWLISGAGAEAAGRLSFSYFTTHLAIHDLAGRRTLKVPVVCHRPRSPLSRPGAVAMRTVFAMARRHGHDLRVAIHPDDTHDRHLTVTTVRVLARAVDSGIGLVPYRTYLEAI